MNALGPPKRRAGELGSATGRKLIAPLEYSALSLLATLFGAIFWTVEESRSRLADWLDNERSEQ